MIRIQINFTDLRRINAAQKLTQTRVQNAIDKFGNRDKDDSIKTVDNLINLLLIA